VRTDSRLGWHYSQTVELSFFLSCHHLYRSLLSCGRIYASFVFSEILSMHRLPPLTKSVVFSLRGQGLYEVIAHGRSNLAWFKPSIIAIRSTATQWVVRYVSGINIRFIRSGTYFDRNEDYKPTLIRYQKSWNRHLLSDSLSGCALRLFGDYSVGTKTIYARTVAPFFVIHIYSSMTEFGPWLPAGDIRSLLDFDESPPPPPRNIHVSGTNTN
jgi:hypothetical protein